MWAIRLALTGIMVTALGPVAQAEDKRDLAEAKKHFARAKKHQASEKYELAAREYLKAYDLYPNPELLFNAAQVYRLDDQPATALTYYRRYLKQDPDGRASVKARQYIRRLERELGRRSPKARGDDDDDDGDDDDDDDGDDDDDSGDDDDDDNDDDDGTATGSGGGSSLKTTGLIAMGAGAVSLAVGLKFGLDARSISDELSNHNGAWTAELLAKQAQGRSAQTRLYIFSGAGAAALVIGGYLYYKGKGKVSREDRVGLTPVLLPRGAAVSLTGRF